MGMTSRQVDALSTEPIPTLTYDNIFREFGTRIRRQSKYREYGSLNGHVIQFYNPHNRYKDLTEYVYENGQIAFIEALIPASQVASTDFSVFR
jgi:hypothetical protein